MQTGLLNLGMRGVAAEEINTMSRVAATQLENQVQFLSLVLGDEEYAVDILRVQEIRSWEPVSRIPNVAAYEKGVVNLRAAIVPSIDLRARFGLPHLEYSALTVVVVVVLQSITQTGKTRVMGVVVDSVSDVMDVARRHIVSVR